MMLFNILIKDIYIHIVIIVRFFGTVYVFCVYVRVYLRILLTLKGLLFTLRECVSERCFFDRGLLDILFKLPELISTHGELRW